ncbi:MAG: hypothetical protein PHO66_00140 [Eubacteriales bacterium]|nr:hypothetical protein [Eubacteriales bacterium]
MAKSRYKEVEYSRSKVKKAGRIFATDTSSFDDKQDALLVINNGRAAHAFQCRLYIVT